MLERIEGVPAGIDTMRAVGKLSREDYRTVVVPLIDDAVRSGRRLRILCEVGPEWSGLTPGAAWEDVKAGLRGWRVIEGCAVLTDTGWIKVWTRIGGFLVPSPLRVFRRQDKDEAVAWLTSLPQAAGITHRLLADSGVVVVEVAEPLRTQDFDALGRVVDDWVAEHGTLTGLVIHAPAIPGWQNVASLSRHLRFVRDHHRRIGRVALAADGTLAQIGPAVVRRLVQAEVRTVPYADLDAAITWAAGPTAARPAHT